MSSLLVDLRLDLEAARNEGGGGDGGEGGDGGIAASSCLFWLEKIHNIKKKYIKKKSKKKDCLYKNN